MTPTAAQAADRWAVHAWDGETWHTYQPDTNTRAAAEAVAERVKGEHPGWGVKTVNEAL